MKNSMDLAPLWKFMLIGYLPNSSYYHVWTIKSRLQFFGTALLQRRLFIWLQCQKYQVSYIKVALNPTPISICLLLVLGCLQIFLKGLKDVLVLVYPILGLGNPATPNAKSTNEGASWLYNALNGVIPMDM
jgi:hypothetical protein